MNRLFLLSGPIVLVLIAACGRPQGVVLPAGDPVRGRATFVKLQCTSCHTVGSLDLPQPVADPPVGMDLAVVQRRLTPDELVTAIIHPSHEIAPRWAGGVTLAGGRSRMGDYTEVMTVRELVDLVAFLQTSQEPLDRRLDP